MADDNLAADILDGIPAIAAFLGLPVRRTYELAEKKKLPLFKIGGRKWQGRKSTLKRHIERLDSRGNGEAALMTKRSKDYYRAMDWMRRPDARMVLTNYHGKPDYWITPGGYRIEPEVAQRIIASPLVRAGKDALFPGMDQTWRLRRGQGAA